MFENDWQQLKSVNDFPVHLIGTTFSEELKKKDYEKERDKTDR